MDGQSMNRISKHRARKAHRAGITHVLRVESLEARNLMIAEGDLWTVSNQSFDTSGLGGTISGTMQWGNGRSSEATLGASPGSGPLRVRIDYSLDSNGFFSDPARRDLLQRAADSIISRFSDNLLDISPSGTNQWSARFNHPATGSQTTQANLLIATNELLVFAGGRSIGGGTKGLGNRGGQSSSGSQAFVDQVRARGQTGFFTTPSSDLGPWGGSITFDTATNWHFGLTTAGLDADETDFISVAAHEFFHVLGFGTSDSFDSKISSGGFNGPNSIAIAGQSPVPMSDPDHFSDSLISNGQKLIMTNLLSVGERRIPTRLDLAALQDIGWSLITPTIQVSGSHTYGDNGLYAGTVTLRGSSFGERTYALPIANITNAVPVWTSADNLVATAGVTAAFPQLGRFTDAGFGESLATPPSAETFTYSINWGDGTAPENGAASVELVGSAGQLTVGSFGGSHSYSTAGTYTITLSVRDDDGGEASQTRTIQVGAPPALALSIDKGAILETAGPNTATLTVRRQGFDLSQALVVNLSNSDPSEISLPASVVIPAGVDSLPVLVGAVDDTLLDGTIVVSLQASAGSIASDRIEVQVLDVETLGLSINRSTFGENEGGGAAVLTVSRSNTNTESELIVTLTTNDASEATVPSNVVIPAGSQSTTVGVTAVDDDLFDGTQFLKLTASEARYSSAIVDVSVTDYQPLVIVPERTSLAEEGQNTTNATIAIRSPAPSGGVAITLATSLPSQLSVPPIVTIPAGATSVEFVIRLANDFAPQGTRNARVTASGPGLVAGLVDLVLSDTDLALWTNPVNRLNVDGLQDVDPLDVLALINAINEFGPRQLDPNNAIDRGLPFVDTNRDGFMDPLDVLEVINALNAI
jgi:PKD repeat protein